ncbi:lipopolysaccharide assembly protein LapB [Celerinatantimonas diazotrophica]|uniref:Lipopolysaccharide assembly protein B n=1 Tax=Celerinatantimonas diazotrophica TaxID=412034 RepID=A0A4R1K381_9GAMM|nr:lipopolysaccharide assembly protein LapB [Celerinatantimonas diazotrophica]TCK58525.1 lipopolysaccharide biosynthesis regulator YciM [Celerinatantimonas diazotrophica]CAG9297154.1 Lipopolysaccharide assembly protein B [Celerinatantimonas diazotrophica]
MFGLLFLLLPVAVAYGWYMGQRSVRQQRKRKSNQLSRQYVTGLNLLLSDQSDKAVDLFIDLLQVDSDTIETHLALGNLFRQRGEVDRAIRIHQNLIARPNLDVEQRQLALLQLSKDYQVAGLFDRAESILLELTNEPEHSENALKNLLFLYQQTREWRKAIGIGEQISPQWISNIQTQISHFYCELALEEETSGNFKRVQGYLRKALQHDSRCVRARLHLAQFLVEQQRYKEASRWIDDLPEIDVDLLSDYVPLVEQIYEGLVDERGFREYLERAMRLGAGASVTLKLATLIEHENIGSAQRMVLDELKRRPTMRGFHKLIDYHVQQAEPGQARQSLQALRDLVARQMLIRPRYRCQKCGFSSHAMYWHCPSCKSWGTVKPVRGLDGE